MKQVDVPTLTGAFGILPAHVPTLQVLRPGVVTVFSDDGSSTKYFGKVWLLLKLSIVVMMAMMCSFFSSTFEDIKPFTLRWNCKIVIGFICGKQRALTFDRRLMSIMHRMAPCTQMS